MFDLLNYRASATTSEKAKVFPRSTAARRDPGHTRCPRPPHAGPTIASMIPLTIVRGDATSPRAQGPKVITHVCNDRGGDHSVDGVLVQVLDHLVEAVGQDGGLSVRRAAPATAGVHDKFVG